MALRSKWIWCQGATFQTAVQFGAKNSIKPFIVISYNSSLSSVFQVKHRYMVHHGTIVLMLHLQPPVLVNVTNGFKDRIARGLVGRLIPRAHGRPESRQVI